MNDKKKPYRLIYINFWDLSGDDGKSLNEREFVRELLLAEELDVVYIGPKMKQAVELSDSRIIARRNIGRSVLSQIAYQGWLLLMLWQQYRLVGGKMIICVRPHYFTISPLFFKWLFRVPYVVKCAGLPVELISKMEKVPFLLRWIGIFVHVLNALSGVRLWAVTGRIGEYWHKKCSVAHSRIFVLPNGVNTNLFNVSVNAALPSDILERIPPARHYIGYAGDLRLSGVEFVILAGEKLIKSGHDYVFIIAGRGEDYEMLVGMSKERGVADRVVFLGRIPYVQLPALYNLCSLLMATFPSTYAEKWGSSSQKIFQYLACGKPVVAARAEDHMFIKKEDLGKLVVSEDIDTLADIIVKTIESDAKNSGVKRRERYDYVAARHSYRVVVNRFAEQMDDLWRS